ncbi:MAG: hypothetical protein KDE22_15690 [Rhodobacterales bacterium]|nr:hypothetical protein [Rhodobacterales bacterium]
MHYVRVDGDRVTVAYTIDAGTLDVARDRLRERVDELAPLGNPTVVGEYYRHLMQRVRDGRLRNGISMAYFMREAFALAAHRGAAGDPVKENQAALLALSMYCGSWLVEKAIGTVRTADLADHKPACSQVTLSGRKDLRQHFILSAAIKLASDTGLATMVGEFKELLDTNAGGSGFSFSDLAADRAGVRLAEVATDPATARTLAALMARGPTEAGFFPSIAGLPDNLTETAFTQRFGTVESEPYRAMVADIDGRIARLAAYGGDAAGLRTLAALPMQPAAPAPVSVPRQNPTAPRASTLPNRAIGPANPNDDKALRRLLAQEAKLLQRFTDRHPDVLAVREAIRQRRKALGME